MEAMTRAFAAANAATSAATLWFRGVKRRLVSAASRLLIKERLPSAELATALLMREILAEKRTMVSPVRLRHLAAVCTSPALPPGSLVECGVARGGCLAVMTYVRPDRRSWGFDSFQAMPPLSEEDQGDGQSWVGYQCSGPLGLAAAEETLTRFKARGSVATLVAGWFEDTLPVNLAAVQPIAVLRLDNDWYRSTRFCLETLYGAVAPGGFVLVDDYHTFAGCRRAVDEFRLARGIRSPLIDVELDSEVCWRKEEKAEPA